MKRILSIVTIIALASMCHAQSSWECENYIKQYDVPSELKSLPKDKVAEFWWKRHWYDQKIDKIYSAKSKTAKRSLSEYVLTCNTIKSKIKPNKYCDLKYKGLLGKLDSIFNLNKIDSDIEIHINPNNEFNSSTYPTGLIFLNTGLIEKLDTMEIVAVLAHEIQHFVGKHSLNHIYAANKKERNNKMWAELGGALAATAVAYSGAYNSTYSSSNNAKYQQNVLLAGHAFDRDAYLATSNYKMRYSREQEIEADIASYRFLQFIGADPNIMIRVLDKIATMEGGRSTSKKDDHPSAVFRKNVLLAIEEYDKKYK